MISEASCSAVGRGLCSACSCAYPSTGRSERKGFGQSLNTLRRHKRMRQRVISRRGYVTSNVGAQKKKLSPAGIEPGTQRVPAQRPTNSTTPSHRRKSSGLWYGTTRWIWVNMGFSRGVKSNRRVRARPVTRFHQLYRMAKTASLHSF